MSDPTAPSDHARLAALYEVTQALGHSLNLDKALRVAVDAAIRLTRAERGFLVLRDDNAEDWHFHLARTARHEDLPEAAFEVSRTIVERVLETHAAIITTNAQHDARFANQESITQYALRSIMAVPLTVRGKVSGVLYVDNKVRVALFDKDDLNLLETFAAQAAIAIDNARLYTHTDAALSARLSDLQTMQAIDRQLNTTLDIQNVAHITLEWAMKRTHAEGGWLGLVETDSVRIVSLQGPGVGHRPPDVLPLTHPLVNSVLAGTALLPAAPLPLPGEQIVYRRVSAMRHNHRPTAVIVIERVSPFTASDVEFLARLTDHAAIALENARLYEAVKTANEAKSKFVSVVSHELRLPMTSIKGYTDLLRSGMVGAVNEQQLQFLNIIRNNVERMNVLVSDLSDISRLETGRLKLSLAAMPLAEALTEVVESFKTQLEGKGQVLTLDVPADLPPVYADPARVIQILSNLVSNAHKYSAAGSAIALSVAVTGDAPVTVRVTDTGYGISAVDQAKLFGQFFRSDDPKVREQPGWGLGLHVTKLLVEAQGGQLTVESEVGRGSVFVVTLARVVRG